MSSWRLAKSLAVLRDQVDKSAPGRNKDNDGTIGDTSHAARKSDHNPNGNGVVTAIDFTHSPETGFDSYKFAEILRNQRDPRIKYVISNRKIFSSTVSPWKWRPYNGSNPHSQHVHVSVEHDYDDTSPWRLDSTMPQDTPNVPDPNWPYQGKVSWYSQLPPKWIDEEDEPGSNKLGVPDSQQGIALPNAATLGQYFDVMTNDGRVFPRERQTDVGPGAGTGRSIDISAALAERMGFTPDNFPTDSIFKWRRSLTTPTPVPTPTPGPSNQDLLDVLVTLTGTLHAIVAAIQEQKKAPQKSTLGPLLSMVTGSLPQLGIWGVVASVALNAFGMLGSAPVAGAENATAMTTFTTFLGMLASGVLSKYTPPPPAEPKK